MHKQKTTFTHRDNTCKNTGTCAQNLHHHPPKNARIWHPPKCNDLAKKCKDFDPKNARKNCKEKTQGSKKTRIGRSGQLAVRSQARLALHGLLEGSPDPLHRIEVRSSVLFHIQLYIHTHICIETQACWELKQPPCRL